MTTTVQNVPAHGVTPTPTPAATPQGFQVPPAGPPAQVPNGNPIVGPGQTPGHVVPPLQSQQPAQPAQPAGPDLAAVTALLQAALAQAPQPGTQVPATAQQSNLNTLDLNTIQDPIIRSMATVMQSAGKDLNLDRVLGKALEFGDPALIDMAYLQEAGGPAAQQLAEIAKGIVQAVAAKSDAIEREVYALVGGQAQWAQATAVFNQVAPQELRTTVAQMFDSTNENFIKAAAKIVAEFSRSSGHVPQHGAPLLSVASAGVPGQGLSKAQFQQELQKIKPDTPDFEEARKALYIRRSLGKRAGL